MIRRLLYCLVLLLALPAHAERLSNGFTQHPEAFFRAGFWWDSGDPGWGLDLHRSGDALVGAWATHDESGQPTWYLGVGALEGESWVMPMQSFRWSSDGLSQPRDAGTVRLTFSDGQNATMEWTLGGRSGSHQITPYVVREQPVLHDRTGFWYETRSPGYGLSVVTQADLLMTVFFFYDTNGEARWVWADNVADPGGNRLHAWRIMAECPGCPDADPVAERAGSLTVAFQSENHGLLSTEIIADDSFRWSVSDRIINLLSNRSSGRSQPFSLMPFASTGQLEAYLDTATAVSAYPSGDVNFSPAPSTAEVSTTNLQEAGVDEGDIVKTDGEYLYTLDDGNVRGGPHRLRVFRLPDGAGAEPDELARLDIDYTESIDGLYLVTDRGEGRPDLLVVSLGGAAYYAFDIWFAPWPWMDVTSRLLVYEVDDPSAPELRHHVEVEGGAIESRRIGDSLYLVTRFHATGDGTPADQRLPAVTVDGERRPLVAPQDVLLPPQPPGYQVPDLITISEFDLANPGAGPASVGYLGLAETVYVSQDNVYIASSRYASSIDPGFDALTVPGTVFTDVHQFQLGDAGPAYRGSGAVEGFVAWGGTSPSFSFSEHEGHLRLVTSSSWMWREGEHRVSVLALADDQGLLRQVGFAPSPAEPRPIGKPGEALYGLRFLGDRLYAVSFKQIDPLYVVDLSRPNRPKVLGELEVTGFSDYLHPLPGELLLGFGKAAVPATGFGDGNFAWYQGLQVSLFDVADPLQPSLLGRYELGRRGSTSPLLADHHALTYLPANPEQQRPARIAIPVVLHDVAPGQSPSPNPSEFYPWALSGMVMFDLTGAEGSAPELILRDIAVVRDARNDPLHDSYLDGTALASRAVVDALHGFLFFRGELYQTPWGDAGGIAGPF